MSTSWNSVQADQGGNALKYSGRLGEVSCHHGHDLATTCSCNRQGVREIADTRSGCAHPETVPRLARLSQTAPEVQWPPTLTSRSSLVRHAKAVRLRQLGLSSAFHVSRQSESRRMLWLHPSEERQERFSGN